jgi:pilus assembly protein Flp/PilA
MNHLILRLQEHRSKERGASAVEYGLMIAGIAALIVISVFALGPIVAEMFDDTCVKYDEQMKTTVGC